MLYVVCKCVIFKGFFIFQCVVVCTCIACASDQMSLGSVLVVCCWCDWFEC